MISAKLVKTAFLLLAGTSPAAYAGPVFPCPLVSVSENGKFLVMARAATGTKSGDFAVLSPEHFVNEGDRLNSDGTFWSGGRMWSVDPPPKLRAMDTGCTLSLVSNDGRFVLLLKTGPVFQPEESVIQIYRRPEQSDPPYHGVLVRTLALADICPLEVLRNWESFWTDHTPQWFSGGTFTFSSDNKAVTFIGRWHNTVRIGLANGEITKP